MTFANPVAYSLNASQGYSAAVADVNGDGKLDVLVAGYGGIVMVLLGNGDGTFQPAVSYSTGGLQSVSVAVADVNGDGKPDLAVANGYNNSVGVLMGNGDGTFQPAVSYGAGGAGASFVVAVDVNRDGHPDLIVTNPCVSDGNCQSGSVGVLLGNGDGTFRPAVSFGSGGLGPLSVTVGDVNGDGVPDLLIANSAFDSSNYQGGAGVLLGNGDGTFQTALVYRSIGYYSSSVAAADINQDGKLDLLLTDQCASGNPDGPCVDPTGAVSLLLGNGDGTFQTAVEYYSGGYGAGWVSVGDFNGDGKPDVAVTNACLSLNTDGSCADSTGSVGLLLGNGDGTFQAPVTYLSGGFSSQSLAAADLNGDGKPDLVVTNACASSDCGQGSAGVLINTSLPAVALSPSKLIFSTQVVFTNSKAQTVKLTNIGAATLVIGNISTSGPFKQTTTCGATIATGGSCTFTVTFKPTTIGMLTGAVSITDNAANSPQSIPLAGIGTYVQLSPTNLNFGNQPVGTKSLPKKITLSNKGSVAVNLTGVSVTGADAANFTETNNCRKSVPAGASCFIEITFTPSATGKRTATVSVSDNGGGSPQKVTLTGNGT